MRAVSVLTMLVVTGLLTPVSPVKAAGNLHNSGSCSACHPVTPRFGIDTRYTVSYTTSADDPGLCTSCHPAAEHPHPVLVAAGSGPSGARMSGYLRPGTGGSFAGTVVCTSCHFIHASDSRYGLLRGFPGSPDPRQFTSVALFCDECHGGNLAKRSAHAGGDRSCAFCHAGKPSQQRQARAPAGFKVPCELCHRGVEDDHFAKSTPFDKVRDCQVCHDHHGVSSASPGLLSQGYRAAAADSVVVSPHFRRALCFSCHANTDDYALRDEDVNILCDRCHASGKIRANIHPLRQVPQTITVPKGWPLSAGALTCLTCHDQGHEDQARQPWMLRGGPYASSRAVCRICHSMVDLEQSRIHLEINEGKSCEMCHKTRPETETDTIKTVTFIADPDLLCLRCHDQNASDGTVHHEGVVGRDLEEGHIAAELPLFNGRVICATCHNPHLREPDGARLREYLDESDYCTRCHPE